MTGIVVLDVVIGLVFVYLLYSLFTSLIAEIIATNLGLRARNLNSAITRMLQETDVNLVDAFKKGKKAGVVHAFYNHSYIKFLSPNKRFSKPSAIRSETFAQTLLALIKEKETKIPSGIDSLSLDEETRKFLHHLWDEANNDIEFFKASIETWFDTTMLHATEWYKRNMQIMLFVIGLMVAWIFNVNTFELVNKLSIDKEAREQMVVLTSSYLENNPKLIVYSSVEDTASTTVQSFTPDSVYHQKLDTLYKIKEKLEKERAYTQSVIGGGNWLPDSLILSKSKDGQLIYPLHIEKGLLPKEALPKETYITFRWWHKMEYLIYRFFAHFWGYVVTAVALSLGAPFWFSMLNKLMKVRAGAASVKATEK